MHCLLQSLGATQRRASRLSLRCSKPLWPDSDSDTDEFINVMSESRKAFLFTQSALDKFRRDHEEGSVVRDPAEYVRFLIVYCKLDQSLFTELSLLI